MQATVQLGSLTMLVSVEDGHRLWQTHAAALSAGRNDVVRIDHSGFVHLFTVGIGIGLYVGFPAAGF